MFSVVNGSLEVEYKTVEVNGRLYDYNVSFGVPSGEEKFVTFDVRGKGGRLGGSFGIPQGYTHYYNARYRIELDGRSVWQGSDQQAGGVSPFDIDLTGVKTLRITTYGGFRLLTPYWEKPFNGKPTAVSSAPVIRPKLLEPAEGFRVKAGSVVLSWGELPEATTYAVQLMQVERRDRRRDPDVRLWSFAAGSKTAFTLDLSDIPNGRYVWSVVAFDDDKIVGKPSEERSFVVDR